MSSYLYSPLYEPGSDLRLLLIDHGQYNEPLVCWLTLQTATTIRKEYEALSYTWGDETKKVPIILCGEEFLVTENLRNGLRHLRREAPEEAKRQLPLWIDAICINQEDSNERDAQVRRMKSIYEQADRVIIWLGRYNEPTDEPLRFSMSKYNIDRVEDNSEAMARSALVLAFVLQEEANQQQTSEVSMGLRDCNYANNLQIWLQLSRLFHRPWFERLWIIQELAVSRKAIVRWGNLQMAWQKLEKAAQFILRPGEAVLPPHIHQMFPMLGAHRITQVALQSMYNFDTQNVLTILHNTQNTKCSDPRDRLYAIRGIVEDNKDIEIDYSTPVQHVYHNWAARRIKRTNSLDILSACADSSRGGDLPSWVPDLRRPFGQDKLLWIACHKSRDVTQKPETMAQNSGYWRQGPIRKHVSPQFQCRDLGFSESGSKLNVSGKYAGRIVNMTNVGDVVKDLPDPTDPGPRLRQIILDWETVLYLPSNQSDNEYLAPKGFKESLLRSFYPWSKDQPNHDVLSMPYDIWRGDRGIGGSRHSLQYFVSSGLWDISRHEVTLKQFERDLFPRVHGCQMFTIEAGRTGIVAGNCGIQVGDELWLLSGGLTAFVLRRVNEVEHRLISPCKLFGMMYADDVELEWQKVVLV